MTSKEGLRVLLVDPHEATRRTLLAQFEQIEPIWLAGGLCELCRSGVKSGEIHPDVTVVVANDDLGGAATLIRASWRRSRGPGSGGDAFQRHQGDREPGQKVARARSSPCQLRMSRS